MKGWQLGWALVALASTTAIAAESAPSGRLPRTVTPDRYRLELNVDPRQPEFGGRADIAVTVHEPTAVEGLGKLLAYGSRVGGRLELSLLESAYLAGRRQLEVRDAKSGRRVPRDRLERRARRLDPRFRERLAAYQELRERRLVVKTGFKYGAHFRAYPRNPENAHARYLVQALPEQHVATWPEVAGAVRVAQGVRKEFLVASVAPGSAVRFLSLERIRP